MDYAALATDAAALIAEFGQPATLRRSFALTADLNTAVTVDATAKTFTLSQGSWVTDGFAVGMSVTFAGFANSGNNAAFVVSGVSALVLTCSTATGLVDEADVYNVTANATADYACSALKDSVNSRTQYEASLMPGSLITAGTRFYQIASTTKPKVGDKLVLSLETDSNLVIKDCDPLSPGGVDILYSVRVAA